MTTYSAAQAISPAIERTKQFLFSPFRLGRFLKLTLVATLTEGGMASCNGNWNVPSGKHGGPTVPSVPDAPTGPMTPFHMPALHWPSMPVLIGIAVAFVVIVIPLGILLSYLLIRLRFSYFDCVLRGKDKIAPAWGMYHRQAMRYLGLSLCVGLGFWVVLIPLGYGLYQHFKPLFARIGSASPPNFFDFLPLIGIVVPLILLLVLVGGLVDLTLSCFVLPRMALEDASIGEAVGEVWGDLREETGQFALFVLLRFLLTIAASIVGMIALAIPFVVVALIGVVLLLILKAMSAPLAVVLGVPAGILVVGLLMLAGIGVSGTIGTFRRNYALLFYAGRYPELAVELSGQPPFVPPASSPFTPPPNWHGSGPVSGSGEGV